jgi:hypothetical protein
VNASVSEVAPPVLALRPTAVDCHPLAVLSVADRERIAAAAPPPRDRDQGQTAAQERMKRELSTVLTTAAGPGAVRSRRLRDGPTNERQRPHDHLGGERCLPRGERRSGSTPGRAHCRARQRRGAATGGCPHAGLRYTGRIQRSHGRGETAGCSPMHRLMNPPVTSPYGLLMATRSTRRPSFVTVLGFRVQVSRAGATEASAVGHV